MSETPADEPTVMEGLDPGVGNILFNTWLVSRAVHALIDDAIQASGLDADEFAIYSTLAAGHGVTPTELADWMAAPTTTVSSYVKRFERRGHVTRVPNPEDRRSYHLQLTPAGRATHRVAGELFAPTLAAVQEALGSQNTETNAQLLRLRRIVDAANRAPSSTRPVVISRDAATDAHGN